MSEQTTSTNNISVRDLVTIGIFTAIYFILFFICAWTAVVPIMMIGYPVLSAFITGIPMILFFTKVKKFGMITIFALIQGIINTAMGYGIQSLVVAFVIGMIADLIMRAGKYRSWKFLLLSYVIFSEWVVGTMMPMFILKEAYLEPYRATQGDAYVEQGAVLLSNWMVPVVIIAIAVAAVIGAFLGHAVLKKHFKRAGIV